MKTLRHRDLTSEACPRSHSWITAPIPIAVRPAMHQVICTDCWSSPKQRVSGASCSDWGHIAKRWPRWNSNSYWLDSKDVFPMILCYSFGQSWKTNNNNNNKQAGESNGRKMGTTVIEQQYKKLQKIAPQTLKTKINKSPKSLLLPYG